MRKYIVLCLFIFFSSFIKASSILIPMDEAQKNHLKAYGIAYLALSKGESFNWILNYRGGAFLMPNLNFIQTECSIRNVSYEILPDAQVNAILRTVSDPESNADIVKLEKAPKIAVYSPKSKRPWDDAVTLALTYSEIPYAVVYDSEIIKGELPKYDWLHLHHEDFTGQYGRFYSQYHSSSWYKEDVAFQEKIASDFGFKKVSQMKLAVAKAIKNFTAGGGFLFAMCSGTDSFDIALAAGGIDICATMFDGDPADPEANNKLDYSKTFAFKDFRLDMNPYKYELSNIDVYQNRSVTRDNDFFTLFEFSAKWDVVPTMLTQNHQRVIKGFMGKTTAFRKSLIKPDVLIMGENKSLNEARYIHGEFGNGTWTFYSGHDPEDYRHLVGDSPTDLDLHPNSPGYRLILNNILFPAAKKKKQKT